MASELPGEFVEVGAHLILAAAQGQLQGFRIVLGLWNFRRRLAQYVEQFGEPLRFGIAIGREVIKDALTVAPVLHQTGPLQLREMRRDAALPHAQDLLEFGDRQFLALHQQEDPQPARIGQEPKVFQD